MVLLSVIILLAGEDKNSILLRKNIFTSDKLQEATENPNLHLKDSKFALMENIKTQTQQQEQEELQLKSGFKAVLLSAAVPGAGEFYAESYWKSALFATIEVAAWIGYFSYEKKGDDKDRVMRKLGDERWSEQRYWTRVYNLAVELNHPRKDDINATFDPNTGYIELTDENIDVLRDIESNNNFPRFTHSLPRTKTQQYYEMIYKYLGQFGPGWIELENFDGNLKWTYYDGGANLDNLTPDVSHYRDLRDKSNDLYQIATDMATVVLFNHLVSAVDAALSVKSYNKKVNYSFYGAQQYYAGEIVNTYGIALSW